MFLQIVLLIHDQRHLFEIHFLFYMLIKKSTIVFASMVTYGIPIIAVAWGIYFGEAISLLQIASLFIILAGVYIVNKPQKQ